MLHKRRSRQEEASPHPTPRLPIGSDSLTGDDTEVPVSVDSDLSRLASEVGARDILVFRRLPAERWAHLGGVGRGKGWAGIVEVEGGAEPLLATAARDRVVRLRGSDPTRIAGPYWASAACVVGVGDDFAVVFGGPADATLPDSPEEDLRRVAAKVVRGVGEVSPAKRLADELEVLHAVQELTGRPDSGLAEAADHVVRVAAKALSCDLAVLVTGSGQLAVHAPDGLAPAETQLRAALAALAGIRAPRCIQDTMADPLPGVLGPDTGVVAALVLPLSAPVGGLLVLAHTRKAPRGFTDLCQRLGGQLAEAAGVVLQVAALHEQLHAQLLATRAEARRDPLTRVANRLAWEETLDRVQRDVDSGASVTVVSADLDGLKEANDHFGHAAGDALITALAETLLRVARPGRDLVARLGGDEFALLLPEQDPAGVEAILQQIRTEIAAQRPSAGPVLAASLGAAVCSPGESLPDALRRADSLMYVEKRERHADRTHGSGPLNLS